MTLKLTKRSKMSNLMKKVKFNRKKWHKFFFQSLLIGFELLDYVCRRFNRFRPDDWLTWIPTIQIENPIKIPYEYKIFWNLAQGRFKHLSLIFGKLLSFKASRIWFVWVRSVLMIPFSIEYDKWHLNILLKYIFLSNQSQVLKINSKIFSKETFLAWKCWKKRR